MFGRVLAYYKKKIQARKDHLPDKTVELINGAVEQKGWRGKESNYLFLREKKGRKKPTILKPQEKVTRMFNLIKQQLFKDENQFLILKQVLFSSWKKEGSG